MARQRRVTITDIAAMCGVSVQTVSRVVNGRPDVSQETRAAVEAAIARQGYQPSAVARSLVSRRSRTVGMVAAGLHLAGVSEVLTGVAEACERLGYALLLKELGAFQPPDIVPILGFLASHQVEGVIFDGAQLPVPASSVQAFVPDRSPAMVFLKCEPSSSYTTIGVDNTGAQAAVTTHVLQLGRRRVGYVSGPGTLLEARQRREGWERAMIEAGFAPGPVFEGDWSSASGAAALDALLERQGDLDAVIAANDQMALGLLHEAARRGIAVPSDLAVTGFDGLPEGAYFTPALTTVTQPLREVGMAAVAAVLEEADGACDPGRVITFAAELIVRDSAPRPVNGAPTQT